eukprot:1160461-Pelagomonas_calceolata.AAC.7
MSDRAVGQAPQTGGKRATVGGLGHTCCWRGAVLHASMRAGTKVCMDPLEQQCVPFQIDAFECVLYA